MPSTKYLLSVDTDTTLTEKRTPRLLIIWKIELNVITCVSVMSVLATDTCRTPNTLSIWIFGATLMKTVYWFSGNICKSISSIVEFANKLWANIKLIRQGKPSMELNYVKIYPLIPRGNKNRIFNLLFIFSLTQRISKCCVYIH